MCFELQKGRFSNVAGVLKQRFAALLKAITELCSAILLNIGFHGRSRQLLKL
jgi:hypothetical protein